MVRQGESVTHTHIATLFQSPFPYRSLQSSEQSFLGCTAGPCVQCWSLTCTRLCDPMACSPPGSSVQRMLQARILEWVAISFSRGSSQPRDPTHVSCIAGGFFTTESPGKPPVFNVLVTQSCPTLCDPMDSTACQALLSMGFSRQGYWSGLPFLSPGDLPDPGIEPGSPALQSEMLYHLSY